MIELLSESKPLLPYFVYIFSNTSTFSFNKFPLLSYILVKLARIDKFPTQVYLVEIVYPKLTDQLNHILHPAACNNNNEMVDYMILFLTQRLIGDIFIRKGRLIGYINL